jgi:hypothetical protein
LRNSASPDTTHAASECLAQASASRRLLHDAHVQPTQNGVPSSEVAVPTPGPAPSTQTGARNGCFLRARHAAVTFFFARASRALPLLAPPLRAPRRCARRL